MLPSAASSSACGGCKNLGAMGGSAAAFGGGAAATLASSRFVSLQLMITCSLRLPILNLRLFTTFSSGMRELVAGGMGVAVQVPSLCARMMTDTVRVGSGGGVLLKRRRANSLSVLHTRFFQAYSGSSPSESEGCGVNSVDTGEACRFLDKNFEVSLISNTCKKKKNKNINKKYFTFTLYT